MIRTTATPHSAILRALVRVRGPRRRSSAILLILKRNLGRHPTMAVDVYVRTTWEERQSAPARVIRQGATVRVSEYEEALQMSEWYMYKRRPWVSMKREYKIHCNADDSCWYSTVKTEAS